MRFLSEIILVLSSLSTVAMGVFAFFTYKLTRELKDETSKQETKMGTLQEKMVTLQEEFNEFTKKSFEQERQPLIEAIGSQTGDDDAFAFYRSKIISQDVEDKVKALKGKNDGEGTPFYLREKKQTIDGKTYKANIATIKTADITDITKGKQMTVFYQFPLLQ